MIAKPLELGAWIRSARKAALYSQVELAHALGIDHTYLSKIESGKMLPSPKLVRSMCIALGVVHDRDKYKVYGLAGICPHCGSRPTEATS